MRTNPKKHRRCPCCVCVSVCVCNLIAGIAFRMSYIQCAFCRFSINCLIFHSLGCLSNPMSIWGSIVAGIMKLHIYHVHVGSRLQPQFLAMEMAIIIMIKSATKHNLICDCRSAHIHFHLIRISCTISTHKKQNKTKTESKFQSPPILFCFFFFCSSIWFDGEHIFHCFRLTFSLIISTKNIIHCAIRIEYYYMCVCGSARARTQFFCVFFCSFGSFDDFDLRWVNHEKWVSAVTERGTKQLQIIIYYYNFTLSSSSSKSSFEIWIEYHYYCVRCGCGILPWIPNHIFGLFIEKLKVRNIRIFQWHR